MRTSTFGRERSRRTRASARRSSEPHVLRTRACVARSSGTSSALRRSSAPDASAARAGSPTAAAAWSRACAMGSSASTSNGSAESTAATRIATAITGIDDALNDVDSVPARPPPTSATSTCTARAVRERMRVVRSVNAAATRTAPAAAGETVARMPLPKAPTAPLATASDCAPPLAQTARSTPSHTSATDEATGPKRFATGASANSEAAATMKASFLMTRTRSGSCFPGPWRSLPSRLPSRRRSAERRS